MDTTTAFISAALKPGEIIYCNPPSGVDLGLGSNGLPRVWKLRAPLEGTRPAAMRWTQSSSIPIRSFGFVPIGSGGAFWMYYHPPDEMYLCTHVDDFLLSATTTVVQHPLHGGFMLIMLSLMIANSFLPALLLDLIFFETMMLVKCFYHRLLLLIVCLSKNLRASCAEKI